jgi:hypothetical protein
MSTITGTLSTQEGLKTSSRVRTFVRAAIWTLPLWTAMIFFGTLTHQPDPQTEFAKFAAYVTTSQFLFSHLVNSIAGAAIGSIGMIALMLHLQDSPVAGKVIAGTVAAVAGNTLTASVFGAAAFAQTAVGHAFLNGNQDALYYYNLVYSAPIIGTAVVGLLLFLVGGVFTGIAITKSGRFPRWTGWMYAIASVAFAVVSFIYNVAQTFTVVFLFASTLVVAWNVTRKDSRLD